MKRLSSYRVSDWECTYAITGHLDRPGDDSTAMLISMGRNQASEDGECTKTWVTMEEMKIKNEIEETEE